MGGDEAIGRVAIALLSVSDQRLIQPVRGVGSREEPKQGEGEADRELQWRAPETKKRHPRSLPSECRRVVRAASADLDCVPTTNLWHRSA